MAKAKKIEGLDCESPALAGMRLVLLERLDEMCAFRLAALNWSEVKGVHDMRVASRRLRSVLKDFHPYLLEKVRQRKLRELARALGAVRDEDVAIAALEQLAVEAPEDVAGGLHQLVDERRWRRERAHTALEEVISEEQVKRLEEKLKKRFEQSTHEPDERAGEYQAEALSFGQAGVELIRNRLEELKAFGESLYNPFDVERLHSMRIVAKRLRYAMELFSQCLGEHLHAFSAEIVRMQQALGDIHDSDVWIAYLGERLRQSDVEREGTAASREQLRGAAIWLLQHFTKEHACHYRQAVALWFEWEKTDFISRLLAALYEGCGGEPGPHYFPE